MLAEAKACRGGARGGQGAPHCSVAVPMCWALGSGGPSTGRHCSNLAETTPPVRMPNLFMYLSVMGCGGMGAKGSRDGARVRGGAHTVRRLKFTCCEFRFKERE